MDERRNERLSRYLDGDLSDAEATEVERALENDPELRADLEAAQRLRRAVWDLAAGMEPPAELDLVMEPLRRGAPASGSRVRPVYRWLGAAAAVVLGVTVAMEMVRRNPSPDAVQPTRSVAANGDDREIFELAPLPSAVPDDNRPIGATDRLLEEEPPAPAAPEPPALEVVGPLTSDEASVAADEAPPAHEKKATVGRAEMAAGESLLGEPERTDGPADQAVEAVADGRKARELAAVTGDKGGETLGAAARTAGADTDAIQRRQTAHGSRESRSTGRVVVDGVEVWSGPSGDCAAGRWPVVLVIRDGLIVELRSSPGEEPAPPSPACRPEGLIGARTTGLPDGEVAAEIEVLSTQ
jgi:hypothetical protein